MTEDIYAKPDLSKKNRFQTGVKEDKNTDACDDIDDVRIYDNYCAPQSTPPETSQDNTTEDRRQTDVSSGKRSVFRAAAVLLGLLCLLLLAAVMTLLVLHILERNRLWGENADLNSERDKLRTSYNEMKGLCHKMTLKTIQLENENELLNATNNNLTQERDELQKLNDSSSAKIRNLTEEREALKSKLSAFDHYLQPGWVYFYPSLYYISSNQTSWQGSRADCQQRGADLIIINSKKEQKFVNGFQRLLWIGLTERETEGNWKWVDGTALTTSYWNGWEPNGRGELNCAEISVFQKENSWNDARCDVNNFWICEKVMAL